METAEIKQKVIVLNENEIALIIASHYNADKVDLETQVSFDNLTRQPLTRCRAKVTITQEEQHHA